MAEAAAEVAAKHLAAACPEAPGAERCIEPLDVGANHVVIHVTATTSSGCILGMNALDNSKQPCMEKLVYAACDPVIRDIRRGACLDEHAVDQVIIFMALAEGESIVRTGPLTEHTRTAIHFAQLCTGAQFTVTAVSAESSDLHEVWCSGMPPER